MTIVLNRMLELGTTTQISMSLVSAIASAVVLWVIAGIQWRATAKSKLGNVASKSVAVLLYIILALGTLALVELLPKLAEHFS